MTHEMSFEFTRDFIRNGLRRDHFWWAVYSVAAFLVVAGALAAAILAAAGTVGSLWSPVLMATFGVGVVAVSGSWVFRFRRSVNQLWELWSKQAPDRRIRFALDDEAVTIEIGGIRSRDAWAGLRRLWRYPDVWLIEIIKNSSLLFPPTEASDEVKAFMVERCQSAGVRVTSSSAGAR